MNQCAAASPQGARDDKGQCRSEDWTRIILLVVVCGGMLIVGSFGGDLLVWLVGTPRGTARPAGEPVRFGSGGQDDSGALEVPPPPDGEVYFVKRLPDNPGVTLNRFRSGVAIPELVSYYHGEMGRRGWRLLPDYSRHYSENYPGEVLVFTKGQQRQCIIAISTSEREGATMVSVIGN